MYHKISIIRETADAEDQSKWCKKNVYATILEC